MLFLQMLILLYKLLTNQDPYSPTMLKIILFLLRFCKSNVTSDWPNFVSANQKLWYFQFLVSIEKYGEQHQKGYKEWLVNPADFENMLIKLIHYHTIPSFNGPKEGGF